jgi:hypothetical protein
MKRNEIGLRQLHVRRQHQRPRDKALRLSDVKAMFLEMRDPAPPITEMTGEPFKSHFTAEDGCLLIPLDVAYHSGMISPTVPI